MTELPISIFRNEAVGAFDPGATRDSNESLEAALIERAKRDPQAFALLYRRHYAVIAGYVYRRLGDAHVAEDLASDVFLTALRCLGRYRWRGVPFRSWLYAIATNVVNRWLRQNRGRLVVQLADESVVATACQSSANVVDVEQARRALLSLSPKHQAVMSLHYLEGLGVEAVASILRCRIGTVKSRLSRARDALREKLLQKE